MHMCFRLRQERETLPAEPCACPPKALGPKRGGRWQGSAGFAGRVSSLACGLWKASRRPGLPCEMLTWPVMPAAVSTPQGAGMCAPCSHEIALPHPPHASGELSTLSQPLLVREEEKQPWVGLWEGFQDNCPGESWRTVYGKKKETIAQNYTEMETSECEWVEKREGCSSKWEGWQAEGIARLCSCIS